jgi:ribosomal protein L18E
MIDNIFDNPKYFRYLAAHEIVQCWLREVSSEELAAASTSMEKDFLKVIDKALSQSGKDNLKENLSKINYENRERLTDSFYRKISKAIVTASDFSTDSLEF